MGVAKVINSLMRKLPNWVVYIILVLPAVYLSFSLLGNQLGPDPIRTYQHKVGEFGLKLIIIGLFVTPLRDLININFFKFRRCIGLVAFLYVCLHFLSYLILDQSLNFNEVWKDIVKRPYITFGIMSAGIMFFLSLTSNNLSIKKLGPIYWKRLHQLVYLVSVGAVMHFLLLTKTWQIEPVIYSIILIGLLGYRGLKACHKRILNKKSNIS